MRLEKKMRFLYVGKLSVVPNCLYFKILFKSEKNWNSFVTWLELVSWCAKRGTEYDNHTWTIHIQEPFNNPNTIRHSCPFTPPLSSLFRIEKTSVLHSARHRLGSPSVLSSDTRTFHLQYLCPESPNGIW